MQGAIGTVVKKPVARRSVACGLLINSAAARQASIATIPLLCSHFLMQRAYRLPRDKVA
jgi:hypothetical protein